MKNLRASQQQLLNAIAALICASEADSELALPDIGLATAALATQGPSLTGEAHCPPLVCELLASVEPPGVDHLSTVLMALRDAAPTLRWFDPYPGRADQAELRAGYFVTVLVGDPTREMSLTTSTLASIFITVQAPHILYPPHSHRAPELYCALAGTAAWTKGDEPFALKQPGSWMVHAPRMTHAMQTHDEPLVALAIWTADLDCDATLDE